MPSQNTCLHAQKPATNKRFNGRGFTAPPTYPDLKESGGRSKRERLHLMEKPHDSISGCKPPGCQAPQSKALSLCSAETWARGGELQMVPETSPQLEVRSWALAATGNPPGAPAAVFGPKGYAFQPGCRGSPEQVPEGIPPPASHRPRSYWLWPVGVAGGPAAWGPVSCGPVLGGCRGWEGNIQEHCCTPPRPQRNFFL